MKAHCKSRHVTEPAKADVRRLDKPTAMRTLAPCSTSHLPAAQLVISPFDTCSSKALTEVLELLYKGGPAIHLEE
ncbi:MAG: hypothetical protein DMG30_23980 [Acidobacteria bacterium]|nr:MAG: hypothetical protein DMG30_23980 [Acidobacteriota bacterium]